MHRSFFVLAGVTLLALAGLWWLLREPPAAPTIAEGAPSTAESAPAPPVAAVRDVEPAAATRDVAQVEETTEPPSPTQAAKSFAVRVEDPDKAAIAGAKVEAAGFETTTDRAGRCSLPRRGKDVWVELAIVAEGFFPLQRRFGVQDEVVATLQPLGHLSGRVLDRGTRTPIGGAILRVPWARDTGANRMVQTDTSGRYEQLAIPIGTSFRLDVEAKGYLMLADMIVIRAEDAGAEHEILLDPAVVVRVLVLDMESGAPIEGASVRAGLSTYESDPGGLAEIDKSFSSAPGMPSSQVVNVGRVAGAFRPSPTARRLTVVAEDYCATMFELESQDLTGALVPLRVVRSCSIEGVLLGPDGLPLADHHLSASLPAGWNSASRPFYKSLDSQATALWAPNASWDPVGPPLESVTTDAEGRFTLVGCPPFMEGLELEVRKEARQLLRRRVGPFGPPGSVERVEIRLEPASGASIHGRLLLNGEPVAGSVRWQTGALQGRVQVEADGQFELTDVAVGEVSLRGSAFQPEVDLGGRAYTDVTLQVVPGARIEQDLAIEVALSTLSGTIRGLDGEPLAGEVIEARPAPSVVAVRTSSASDGTWSVGVRQNELYRVRATVPTRERELEALAGQSGLDFHVVASGKLRYRAQRIEDGELISKVWLHQHLGPGWYFTLGMPGRDAPDASGWRQIELPEGEHALFAREDSGSFQTSRRVVQVSAGSTTEVTFELESAHFLELRLAAGSEPFPANHSIVLVPEASWSEVQGQLDGQGIRWDWGGVQDDPAGRRQFTLQGQPRFGGLRAGRYRLKVFPEDVVLDPESIDVPAKGPVEVSWKPRS